ncbi:MAG: CorA family divalent cation transporter, partial [Candidatus Bathyarchaeota archaeon]
MKKGFITNRLRSGKKSLEESIERKIETIEAKKFTWVDMQNPDRTDVEEFAKKYQFNSLNNEDCMTKFELPKLDRYDDHF